MWFSPVECVHTAPAHGSHAHNPSNVPALMLRARACVCFACVLWLFLPQIQSTRARRLRARDYCAAWSGRPVAGLARVQHLAGGDKGRHLPAVPALWPDREGVLGGAAKGLRLRHLRQRVGCVRVIDVCCLACVRGGVRACVRACVCLVCVPRGCAFPATCVCVRSFHWLAG